MKMTFRWFGEKDDSVLLGQIRQIPGLYGVVTALYDMPAGEIWPVDRILALKRKIEAYGLAFEVVESVNVHEDIKLGLPTRDRYIDDYKQTLLNLAGAGIKVVVYNFMPVFDWLRTSLSERLPDGSYAMYYNDGMVSAVTPEEMARRFEKGSNGFSLPGWEPERLQELRKTFALYKDISEENLFENLKYFLEQVVPTCEKADIKLALHPDDPPWPVFGLPRIVTCMENLDRIAGLADSPYSGFTICSGSLGARKENDIPSIVRHFGKMGRIHFAHVRNIKFVGERTFYESSHLSSDGSLDIFEIMKAYHDIGYRGYFRPDHGRSLWGEVVRPGYGLYDRAMGITYMNGIWEALEKMK